MPTTIVGATGINKIQDGTVVDADIDTLAASKLTGALPALNGANLTSLTAANIAGALPAISGANLTSLPADSTKLPLAGGTLTGDLIISENDPNLRMVDTNTGSYSQLTNTNGSLKIEADLGAGSGSSTLEFTVDNSEKMRIDASGKVGIGVTALNRQLSIGTLSAKTDTATKYVMNIGQTTEASGYAGLGVYFKGHANATSRLWQFQPAEAGVANDGIIEMNPDGGYFRANRGVLFNTDTAAANILDDYEEGSYTPVVTASSGSATYTTQTGTYTKIGNVVTINVYVQANKNNLNGPLKVSLPIACGAENRGQEYDWYVPGGTAILTTNMRITAGASIISMYGNTAAGVDGTARQFQASDVQGEMYFWISMTYKV